MSRLGDNLINIGISYSHALIKQDQMREAFERSVVKRCMQEEKGWVIKRIIIRFSKILQNHFCKCRAVMKLRKLRIFEVDLFLSIFLYVEMDGHV